MQDNKDTVDLKDINQQEKNATVSESQSKYSFWRKKKSQDQYQRDETGKFTSGSGGLQKTNRLNIKRALPLVVVIALVGGFFVYRSFAATTSNIADFSKFYPNLDLYKTHYLNGNNYVGEKSWAVLWFGDVQPNGFYKMYNSDPSPKNTASTCNWDRFQWTNSALFYSETYNNCSNPTTNIKYSPGIVYLPKTWKGGAWRQAGTSDATYYESGTLKCTGKNSWVAEIFAQPVELAPGVMATHVRNTQTTTYTSGDGSAATGCYKGQTARYQENLYFVTDLPLVPEKVSGKLLVRGLKRSVGGSLDRYDKTQKWDWDVWFDNWHQLPAE